MLFKIHDDEFALIQRCLDENEKAYGDLYNKYKDAMYTNAYRITNDFDDAEDVLQEGFMQVFKDLQGFKMRSTLGAWIKTIIVRTAIRKLKSRRLQLFERLDENYSETIVWPEQLNAEYLEKAISLLPDGFRTIFLLIEVEGYTHKEAAELLDISIGNSKSQLFHAKRKLQKTLAKIMQ